MKIDNVNLAVNRAARRVLRRAGVRDDIVRAMDIIPSQKFRMVIWCWTISNRQCRIIDSHLRAVEKAVHRAAVSAGFPVSQLTDLIKV